jgi:PBP1b-binding outer membrane lipoprotein LpoB
MKTKARTQSPIMALLLGAILLGGVGCAASPRYIQSGGPESLTSLQQIPTRALDEAASALVQDLIARGIFQNSSRRPVILAVNPVINDTSVWVDTEILNKQIRVTLNQTGIVETITTYGGNVEDSIAFEQRQMEAFERGTAFSNKPDFTLSGTIRENRVRDGRSREVTYFFDMSLTDVRTGRAPWEGSRQISLQGKKAGIGL